MKEALLYKVEGSKVHCFSCIRECEIPLGGKGFCGGRQNIKGKLFGLTYGYFSGLSLEPLGSKPFKHFKDPINGQLYAEDEKTLSVGGVGCNYQCLGCQNHLVSQISSQGFNKKGLLQRSPEKVVDQAVKAGVRIMAFTWNEPAVIPEIILDMAKEASSRNIRTVYVCNGSPTIEHIDLIAPHIDAFRYDIKAGPCVGDEFYSQYCNLNVTDAVDKILEVIKYTHYQGKHIELLTVLIPTLIPSSSTSIINTAKWILENLGEDTPWHLAKYFPAYRLNNPILKTPDLTITYYANLVREIVGLKNVYAVLDKGCDCLTTSNNKKTCCSC